MILKDSFLKSFFKTEVLSDCFYVILISPTVAAESERVRTRGARAPSPPPPPPLNRGWQLSPPSPSLPPPPLQFFDSFVHVIMHTAVQVTMMLPSVTLHFSEIIIFQPLQIVIK